jgi:hypothetical protein
MTTTILTDVTTAQGNTGWRYVGREDRNREPEITAVDVNGPPRRLRSALPQSVRDRGAEIA